jgi:hypothetical protein
MAELNSDSQPLPSAYDAEVDGVRLVVQATEDGYLGFAFVNGKRVASTQDRYRCDNLKQCLGKLSSMVRKGWWRGQAQA